MAGVTGQCPPALLASAPSGQSVRTPGCSQLSSWLCPGPLAQGTARELQRERGEGSPGLGWSWGLSYRRHGEADTSLSDLRRAHSKSPAGPGRSPEATLFHDAGCGFMRLDAVAWWSPREEGQDRSVPAPWQRGGGPRPAPRPTLGTGHPVAAGTASRSLEWRKEARRAQKGQGCSGVVTEGQPWRLASSSNIRWAPAPRSGGVPAPKASWDRCRPEPTRSLGARGPRRRHR